MPKSPLGELTSAQFISSVWQQKPLFVAQAFQALPGLPDGDTLAGLACEEEWNSRLVIAETGVQTWQCEHGPFEPQRFAQLPDQGWTVLVQAVDQAIPEVASLLDAFDFLPRWRLDDVMMSYAEDGGGVGPHFDFYDVFLLQTSGSRLWEIGAACDSSTPLRDHPDLRLLESFVARETFRLDAGDMLYLPAGVAHCGTALGGDCMTCSIGFRAPSRAETLRAAVEILADKITADDRYRDSGAAIDADPFKINEAVEDQLQAMGSNLTTNAVRDALAQAFTSLVTEPQHADAVEADERISHRRLLRIFAAGRDIALQHHRASRLAYREVDGEAELFVDGEMHRCSQAFARGVCHKLLSRDSVSQNHDRAVLAELLERGNVSLDP